MRPENAARMLYFRGRINQEEITEDIDHCIWEIRDGLITSCATVTHSWCIEADTAALRSPLAF